MSKRKMLTDCSNLMQQWDYGKNDGVSPETMTAGSGRNVWWLCEKGHSWQATVNHRHHGTGCPVCANKIIVKGINDLKTVNPILAAGWNYEKNGNLTPEDVPIGTRRKVWWRCSEGHEWQAAISSRNEGAGCPCCAGQAVVKGVTDLATVCPDLAAQWDCGKNKGVSASDVCHSSNRRYWWICEKGHSWQASANARRKRSGCPVCAGKAVLSGFNDLLTVNSALAEQWDYDKNDLTPFQVTVGSSKSVWWKCSKNHSWKAKISNRTSLGRGCPYCAGLFVSPGENDLATLNPELAKEWHYEKNFPLKPEQVTANTARKAWWICKNGHEWKANIQLRNRGNGCPYCAGQMVLKGENDLLTINPVIAAQWDYEKNSFTPEEVHSQSNRYAWWKCEKGHSWEAIISNRTGLGRGCPYCSGALVITGVNDLKTLNPDLAKQWDYAKNGTVMPETILPNSVLKAWWLCENGHSWLAVVYSRHTGKNGCPYCAGRFPYKPRLIQ